MARARARVPSGECGALRGRRRHQKVPLPDRLAAVPFDGSTGLCCLSIDPSTVLILVEYWPQDSRARESMGNGRGIPSVTSVGTSCARSWSCRSRRRARATPLAFARRVVDSPTSGPPLGRGDRRDRKLSCSTGRAAAARRFRPARAAPASADPLRHVPASSARAGRAHLVTATRIVFRARRGVRSLTVDVTPAWREYPPRVGSPSRRRLRRETAYEGVRAAAWPLLAQELVGVWQEAARGEARDVPAPAGLGPEQRAHEAPRPFHVAVT